MTLTEQLRERGHDDIYIIMLSSRDDDAAYERGYFAGVDDYLSKQLPDPELLARIAAGFRTLALRRSLKQARAALEEASTTDADCAAYSKPHLIKQLNSEITRSQRYNRNLSVLVLQFKGASDELYPTKGYALAPSVLRNLVRILRNALRLHIDWVARYYGPADCDSLAIVLPETGPAEVAQVRRRLQAMIEGMRTDPGNEFADIILAIGAASLDLQGGNDLLDADTMLRVAQLCCQCSATPENHLRAVKASVEAGVLIPCRLGYAISPYCQGSDAR
jgi:diguanylate cyclase (GGDEF)-like protein